LPVLRAVQSEDRVEISCSWRENFRGLTGETAATRQAKAFTASDGQMRGRPAGQPRDVWAGCEPRRPDRSQMVGRWQSAV